MQIDTNKTLRQLYEEGVIRIGTRLYMEVPKGREYVSKVERNGEQKQTFISLDKKYFWEVALEHENNNMFVIGEPFGKLILAGEEGCVYGIEELNTICDTLFTTEYLKARSINIDDVNRVLGVEVIDNKVVQKEVSDKDISSENQLGFKHQYGEEEYSPRSYLKGKHAKGEIECNYYSYAKRTIKEKRIEKGIIFGKKDFWLASPGVHEIGSYVYFGLGTVDVGTDYVISDDHLCGSDGSWTGWDVAVRPVGILKSDIPIKDLPISEIVIPRLRIKLS